MEKTHFSSGSAASGLLIFSISCNGHMSTALLDSGASHNFIALPQLKQFAPNSKDCRWDKPLQVKLLTNLVLSHHKLPLFLCNLHLALL